MHFSVSGFRDSDGEAGRNKVTFYEISCVNKSTGQAWSTEQRFSSFETLLTSLQLLLESTELRDIKNGFPPKFSLSSAFGRSLGLAAKESRQQALNTWLLAVRQIALRNVLVGRELLSFIGAPMPVAASSSSRDALPTSSISNRKPALSSKPPRKRANSVERNAVVRNGDTIREHANIPRRILAEDITKFVVDIGSRSIKAGHVNSSASAVPPCIIPSVVGIERTNASYVGSAGAELRSRIRVGEEAEAMATLLDIKYPISSGVALDDFCDGQSEFNALLKASFAQGDLPEAVRYGDSSSDSGHALLVTAPAHPTAHRQRLCEVLFEQHNAAAVCLMTPEPLELFSAGFLSGCVLSLGHETAAAVPIWDGSPLTRAARRSGVTASDLDSMLSEILVANGAAGFSSQAAQNPDSCSPDRLGQSGSRQNRSMHHHFSSANARAVQFVKESLCIVSPHALPRLEVLKGNAHLQPLGREESMTSESACTLPDGRSVALSGIERTSVPEALFDPTRLSRVRGDGGDGKVGLTQLLIDAIEASDPGSSWETKKSLIKVVLAGGSSLFPGLAERFHKEVCTRVPGALMSEVDIINLEGRQWAAWRGGCVVAEFQTGEGWMMREEYNENGAGAIFDFCYS